MNISNIICAHYYILIYYIIIMWLKSPNHGVRNLLCDYNTHIIIMIINVNACLYVAASTNFTSSEQQLRACFPAHIGQHIRT